MDGHFWEHSFPSFTAEIRFAHCNTGKAEQIPSKTTRLVSKRTQPLQLHLKFKLQTFPKNYTQNQQQKKKTRLSQSRKRSRLLFFCDLLYFSKLFFFFRRNNRGGSPETSPRPIPKGGPRRRPGRPEKCCQYHRTNKQTKKLFIAAWLGLVVALPSFLKKISRHFFLKIKKEKTEQIPVSGSGTRNKTLSIRESLFFLCC